MWSLSLNILISADLVLYEFHIDHVYILSQHIYI